jgi:predicted TIM-barrel fold metal-dependent hydrolase
MDQDAIDTMVMYPSSALSIGVLRESDYATAVARAYNDWLADFCSKQPDRLKFVAVIAPQNPAQAAEELHRAVTELKAAGGMLPTHVPQRPDWGDAMFDPIYGEAQRLNVGLGFHASMQENIGVARFSNFISVHTVTHPVEQMICLVAVVVGGVLERFPKLRFAFLESGIGWVPYIMDRLDEEIEKRGDLEAPWLKTRPSQYIAGGNCFFGVECEEKTIPDALRTTGEDCLLYASDYPHWDGDWPHTVSSIQQRGDLSDEAKRKMLHDNVARFYGFGQ